MRRRRQPDRTANDLLRQAIRQVSAVPLLTSSLLLAFAPAGRAITLGDVNVQSALGQRLNATVPVRLESGESLAAGCVAAGQQAGDLRPVPDVRLSVPEAARAGNYELRLTSGEALYEPMYALELEVQCPGTPILVRQYVLMLDLPGAVATGAAAVAAVAPAEPGLPAAADAEGTVVAVTASPAVPAARPAAAQARPAGRIESGTTYRVAEGDTLSGIAARIAGRNGSLQAVADAIQAANPTAFIRNDPNLIKLGSEIVIPAAFTEAGNAPVAGAAAPPVPAAPDLAAAPAAIPTPALPPALEQVPAPESAPVAATVDSPAVTEAPAPAVAMAPAPAPVRAPATVAAEPAADTSPVATNEPNPFLAAGAGIAFGLVVSTLLWFRGRSTAPKRAAGAAAPQKDLMPAAAATAIVQRAEPGLSVSYTPAAEEALAAEFDEPASAAGEDITSELEELFDSTDTTIQKRLAAEKTVAARALVPDPEGYAPPDVDFMVGDPTAEQPIPPGSTVEQPRPNLDPTVDLRTLASSATGDEQQAQTLLEALTLLERDYEEELTASQVLDMSAVRDALGADFDEPTQIREARLKDAASRHKKG